MDVVSELNVWISLRESGNVTNVGVIFSDLISSKIVIVGILRVSVVSSKVVTCANDNINSDLAIIINLFSASFDSVNEVGVPNGSTIHKNVIFPFESLENSWNQRGSSKSFVLLISWKSFVESNIVSSVDVNGRYNELSFDFSKLLDDSINKLILSCVVVNSRLISKTSEHTTPPVFISVTVTCILP